MYIKNSIYKNLIQDFFKVYNLNETALAMVDVEQKVEYEVERKSGTAHDTENAGDKLKARAKAMGKKVTDPDRDLETEYNVEKTKEKVD
jgi:hypothetical protein